MLDAPKLVIVVRKDLNMRKGKIAGQTGHAVEGFMLAYGEFKTLESGAVEFRTKLRPIEAEWLQSPLKTKIVPYVNSEQELRDLIDQAVKQGIRVHPVVDAGLTEFKGISTLTCAAFGPDLASVLDPITGHLPLL
jgi:peptidyl-tRNA hydrolase, PTH2 family